MQVLKMKNENFEIENQTFANENIIFKKNQLLYQFKINFAENVEKFKVYRNSSLLENKQEINKNHILFQKDL